MESANVARAAALSESTLSVHAARAAFEGGEPSRSATGVAADELSSSFTIASGLRQSGRFAEALPHALELMLADPLDHRYPFLVAECVEAESMEPDCTNPNELLLHAAGLFAISFSVRKTATAAFRLAECQARAGKSAEAIRAFDTAAHMAARDESLPGLKEEARSRAHELHCLVRPSITA